MIEFKYGRDSAIAFEPAGERTVLVFDTPRGTPLVDVASTMAQLLADPREYPPLAKAVVAGDKIAIALAADVPQAGTMIASLVTTLMQADIKPADITLVCAPVGGEVSVVNPLAELSETVRADVEFETHDPASRNTLSYLAATADGNPIYINRTLHDADLVIAVGCLRPAAAAGSLGISSLLFPTFSDKASIERFARAAIASPREQARCQQDADEARTQLGLQFVVAVVPGVGTAPLALLAGDTEAVDKAGRAAYDAAWACEVSQRYDLVVATLVGDEREQNWHNVARALQAAAIVASEDADVLLCTALAQAPEPALAHMAAADDFDLALAEVEHHQVAGVGDARVLAHALARGKVFLLSRLSDDLVEDLGMTPIDPAQIPALIGRYESVVVLPNAQRVAARLTVDTVPSVRPARKKSRR